MFKYWNIIQFVKSAKQPFVIQVEHVGNRWCVTPGVNLPP